MELSEYQIEYIDNNIYPILLENNWENLILFNDNIDKKEIIKKYFPIIETL